MSTAIERFVAVGEKISQENPEISNDMCEACREARISGVNEMISILLLSLFNAIHYYMVFMGM